MVGSGGVEAADILCNHFQLIREGGLGKPGTQNGMECLPVCAWSLQHSLTPLA
jgi:hypothetical protein